MHYHLRQFANSTPILSFTADRTGPRAIALSREPVFIRGNLEQTQNGNQYPASTAVIHSRGPGEKKARDESMEDPRNNSRWRLPRDRSCPPELPFSELLPETPGIVARIKMKIALFYIRPFNLSNIDLTTIRNVPKFEISVHSPLRNFSAMSRSELSSVTGCWREVFNEVVERSRVNI